jgi:hypothetical protein
MSDQVFACISEVIFDLELNGIPKLNEARWLERLKAASDWLVHKCGEFIPVTSTKYYNGKGGQILFVEPTLAVTTLVNDGTTLASSDYLLAPLNRHWPNGPYTWIEVDPDASGLGAWATGRDEIVISGRHGRYEESETTDALVANTTQIAAGGTSLLVSNGSRVSPGMILLIESEQMLVTATESATSVAPTLAEDLDASEEQITLSSASGLNAGEVIRIDYEDMRIILIEGAVLTVDRGWNATTRATHTNGAALTIYRTYTVKRGLNGTTDAAHLTNTAISRYVAPWDINWLTRQICGLMHKKAQGGFSGKSGSVEMGTIFYFDEFPKKQVEDVLRNYHLMDI